MEESAIGFREKKGNKDGKGVLERWSFGLQGFKREKKWKWGARFGLTGDFERKHKAKFGKDEVA